MEVLLHHFGVVAGGLFGIAGHILKKIIAEREKLSTFSAKDYFTLYPYKTAMTFFYAVGGIAGLYFTGTAELYTAMLTGFAANSLSGASDK